MYSGTIESIAKVSAPQAKIHNTAPIHGNVNVKQVIQYKNNDMDILIAKIESYEKLLKEKDERIADLKETINILHAQISLLKAMLNI